MLYPMNALACALAVLVCVVLGRSAAAQDLSPAAPSAVSTMAAYELVEPWVRALEVAENAAGPDVGGARVTLRLRGRVVGRGVAIGRGASTLPDAARLAIDQARGELVTVNDAGAQERARLEAGSLAIALELAGAPVPIEEPTYTLISASISPGTEAVAVRLGAQADAVFPLEMLATGQQAGSAASRIISQLTGDPLAGGRQPIDLMTEANAGFFRLKTTAVAQPAAGAAPIVLYRGGRLVELPDIASTWALRSFALELASWLMRHEDAGAYLPTNGSVIEAQTEASAGLRAFALARASTVLDDGIDAEAIHEQVAAMNPGTSVGGALVGVARHELGLEPRFVPADPGDVGRVERALVGFALARTGESESARELLSTVRSVENASQYVGLMPWFGWAERELAGEGEIPSAVALRQLRGIVTDFQLTAADAGADNLDLVGGVVFTSGALPLPTWQTARPMAFLATMLRDPRLTEPTERDEELASLLNALRFLRQLSATESEGFMYREPAEAAGGVRAATWDQTMSTDATAMTLLTVLETLESLEAITRIEADREPEFEAPDGGR